MSTIFLAFQIFAIYVFTWVVWSIVRHFVVKNPLDNIPGPPNKDFMKGKLVLWTVLFVPNSYRGTIGHFRQLFNVNGWDFHKEIAAKYGPVLKVNGPFGERILYVFDPTALHQIFVKDQYIYEETENFIITNKVSFGDGLLSTLGEHHRKQRKMLNPVFSIAHMRHMVPIFYEVTNKLRDTFLRQVANGPKEIEVLSWLTRIALELIGQSGLGYSFDPLTEDHKEHPYITSVKLLGPTTNKLLLPRVYVLPFVKRWNIGGLRFQRFVVDHLPWKDLSRMRDIVDIMHRTSLEIFESKKKALEQGDEALANQIGQGKDIISILMRANMNASDEDRLPDEEVLGQMSTLTFAAMDTTSSALSRLLYLLSKHQNVQRRLRKEVCEAREIYGDMDYDQLVGLPYLDAVCRETLRLYPPVATVARETRRDAVLPLSRPLKGLDGKEVTEILIPNGTKVMTSILSCNRNPEVWGSDADEWKPERWLSALPDSVTDAHIPGVYSHLMTFVGGGRACIGFKFSQLEMKVVLCVLLEHFQFKLPKKEIFWNMNGISTPSVDRTQLRPELPLIVSRISE